MQYRKFGQLDWKVSVLGFGMMRLPTVDDDPSHIEEEEATRMVHYAIDHGVNYIDTAYPYHREASEPFTGRVLQGEYREKVRLATKMPSWLIEKPEDFDRYLDEQLERLQTHIDFYLLHGLNSRSWAKLRDLNVLDWAEKAMAAGRFGWLGFSFHDQWPVFKEIVDAYDNWTFSQIQYNYMDTDYQAGQKGLQYAADKGLAVVVMEPLRGGQLAKEPPESVAQVWQTATTQRAPVDWALQWLWNQPEVSVVLSGMSTMEHVVENVASADRAAVDSLTPEELALVERVQDAYENLQPVACTGCEYCLPCPSDVNIPRILAIYNKAVMYDDPRRGRFGYRQLKEEQRADQCVECGECEEVCPQGLCITEWLKEAHALLCEEEE
jgi:hypothetical protein